MTPPVWFVLALLFGLPSAGVVFVTSGDRYLGLGFFILWAVAVAVAAFHAVIR